jgi:sodium transport system ATP-binding protein
MIQVRQLSKSFGRVAAVRNLSFDVPDGGITGLLGSNGAGKTTTLRMISGVMNPDAGTIRLNGVSTSDDPRGARHSLGALLDHQGLYPRLTGREHLAYFGRLRAVSPRILKDRVEHAVVALGLTSIADRRVGGFSQGERMKVSLGCAMIHEPSHLLLDEPTNGLDVPAMRALRTWLKTRRASGTCILFSSHVLSEIEELCDRVVIVADGAVAAEGTLEDIRRQADSKTLEDAFVALTGRTEVLSC